MIYGALEAGGTKMVCAVGDESGKIYNQVSIPTTTPEETMPKIISYFKEQGATYDIKAIGVASFGPVDVKRESATYGHILETPKLPWKHYNLLGAMRALGVPLGLDTDVNGSCLGEMTYGSAKGLGTVVYITVGTGIGAGIAVEGRLLHGMLHPEAGHMLMKPFPGDEGNCICPYHSGCLEGFATGPSIERRWGKKGAELADRDEVWELESEYLSEAIANMILTLSPERIILGGGVMHQMQLFPLIRKKTKEKLGGYLQTKELSDMDSYIVPASLGDDQGIMGCIRLAELACS